MLSTFLKRTLFWSMVFFFLVYTIVIYSSGAEESESSQYLTVEAKAGKLVFQQYNCIACHQVYGLGGYMGQDLTNVMSDPGKGEMYVKAFLQSGTQRMPDFKLSEKEMKALIAYLNYIDKTGVSPVIDFELNYIGTITQKPRK
jgi:nitric oxide reductase subunit C